MEDWPWSCTPILDGKGGYLSGMSWRPNRDLICWTWRLRIGFCVIHAYILVSERSMALINLHKFLSEPNIFIMMSATVSARSFVSGSVKVASVKNGSRTVMKAGNWLPGSETPSYLDNLTASYGFGTSCRVVMSNHW